MKPRVVAALLGAGESRSWRAVAREPTSISGGPWRSAMAGAPLLGFRAASTARAMVLATDGGPNCNDALDPRTCRCVGGGCNQAIRCLHDVRTVSRITDFTSQGIPTYVIGIESAGDTSNADALDAMAVAGGRPQLNANHSHYEATSPTELSAALVTIRDQVGACTYLTRSVPGERGTITLTLGGVTVAYDPTGATGWRWPIRQTARSSSRPISAPPPRGRRRRRSSMSRAWRRRTQGATPRQTPTRPMKTRTTMRETRPRSRVCCPAMRFGKALALMLLVLVACGDAAPPVAPLPPSPAPTPTVVAPSGPRAPMAKKIPVTTTIHGQQRVDDYAWLRNKGAPDVVSYLEEENAYTAKMTEPTAPLRETLYQELLGRVKQDDTTPPYAQDGYMYYRRFETGKQYPIRCRKKIGDEKEMVLIDLNEIAKTEKFVDVIAFEISDDSNLGAYLVDTQGFRQYTLKTKDLKTNAAGTEAIPRVDAVSFTKDPKIIYYVTEDQQTKRADKLWRHVLGQDPAKDTLVYEEKDEMFDLDLDRTRDKAFLVVTSGSKTATEVRVIDAAKPMSAPVVVAPREKDHEYFVDHHQGTFYIRTNSGGRNFRLVTAAVTDPSRSKWKEVIPHRPDVMLEAVSIFKDFYVTYEREHALPQIAIHDFASNTGYRIEQPEPVYDAVPVDNHEYNPKTLRFRYMSLKTPVTYVDVDVKTKARTIVKKTEVPNYDESKYESKRIELPARDGMPIPVSLVYKKGTTPDGTHPLFLYAYGSYGISTGVSFSADRASLLDRGFVYAMAHIRGGGDMGKKWHDEGRMMKKMNTFSDFIDVADQLGKTGWAKKDALVAAGGSAGGLLMGAVANMRPDLFKIILAYVPFVDVMNTMLDETLPLTVSEFEEWGNPKERPAYDYMMKYSPYDNVKPQAYPTMLVRTSYNDSQVMYWEPAKWVAKLRANKTDTNPLLFKIAMEPAGHGGQSGRFDRLKDTAFDYAFVLDQLGMVKHTP